MNAVSSGYDRMSPWFWLDVETSGLDPHSDFILEVYVAVTDSELNVWDTIHVVLHHPYNVLLAKASTWCKGRFCSKSHGGNGLFDECNFSNMSHHDAERLLWNFFEYYSSHEVGAGRPPEVTPDFMNTTSDSQGSILHPREVSATRYSTTAPHRSALLAGSTVHFDRQFLMKEFPCLRKFLSHKSIDVTSILETFKRFGKDHLHQKPKPCGTHRAGDDIVDSINLMKYFKHIMFGHGYNGGGYNDAPAHQWYGGDATAAPVGKNGYYRNVSKTYKRPDVKGV